MIDEITERQMQNQEQPDDTEICQHNWQFQGVVYRKGAQLPGSSARSMIYQDRYFCVRCLAIVDRNNRTDGNDYSKPIAGTFPA